MVSDPLWEKMLVTLDSGTSNVGKTLNSADFLVKNTWGEFYFGSIDLAHTENNLLKCHEIAKNIWCYLGESASSRPRYHVCRLGVSQDTIADQTIKDFIIKFRQGVTDTTAGHVDGRPYLDLA
jgi:hypothetical protein